MSKQYDAIVVGGGHNGLTTAAYLAKSGKKVLVLEAKPIVGGTAVTEEIYPGFKYSTCAYICEWLSPDVVRDLQLAKHGLDIVPFPGLFTPMPDGRYFFLSDDMKKSQEEIAKFSKKDAEKYPEYHALIQRLWSFVHSVLASPPPDITATGFSSMREMLAPLIRFRRLGEKDMYELMRLTSMSIEDYLDEWFETDVLKATLTNCLLAPLLGPKSPGTAYFLLHYHSGDPGSGYPRGGMGSVSNAIASAAKGYGAEIRTEAPVAKIVVRNDTATGVVLESGEEISGKIVVSATDAHRTFLKLIDPAWLDPKFLWNIRNFKMTGISAKINLALDGLPEFTCLPGNGPHMRGYIVGTPSMEYWERAFDDAKYGRFPKAPFYEMNILSLSDPSVAPEGKHVASVFVYYVPYDLKEGNWDDRREELGDLVIDGFAKYAPNLKKLILHRQVLTPLDLERNYGLTRGDNEHGEVRLEQLLFMRPVPGWARYRMPIDNLYMCGASTHPGGGITAMPGRNAAQMILKDFGSGVI
ncbi:MAG: NAD(P)/FAD-dependent oxidoreductase [Acidobacteriota bacterium]|nr:MAG: NAD(P)/FAD-dependent oxidoreductase [Acidobacteriota bacterium]